MPRRALRMLVRQERPRPLLGLIDPLEQVLDHHFEVAFDATTVTLAQALDLLGFVLDWFRCRAWLETEALWLRQQLINRKVLDPRRPSLRPANRIEILTPVAS